LKNKKENEEFRLIKNLYQKVINLDTNERKKIINEACGDNTKLLKKVLSLLAWTKNTYRFLETPAWRSIEEFRLRETLENESLIFEENLPFKRLGEYLLVRKLGKGGRGEVYLALQEPTRRKVAIKILRSDKMGSYDSENRFLREINVISQLQHPNIVSMYGCGEDNSVLYLVTEYVSGKNLEIILEEAKLRGKRISKIIILRWIKQIADGLKEAHRIGIIHRDVKPSNIIIDFHGNARLIDFGEAKCEKLSSITLTGEFRGTPFYASPEQVESKPAYIDTRTDVYSLGATLYRMITGKVPFTGKTTKIVFRRILENEPIKPRRLNPFLSKDIETVILKTLEKEPRNRYQKMKDFADDIHSILNNNSIKAKPLSLTNRIWRKLRRQPGLNAVLVLASITVLFLLVFLQQQKLQLKKNEKITTDANTKAEILERNKNNINRLLLMFLSAPSPWRSGKNGV